MAGRFHSTASLRTDQVGGGFVLNCSQLINTPLPPYSGTQRGQMPLVDTLTMDGNKSVTAHFLPAYTITAATNGYGTVTITPLKFRYMEGEVVQVNATPARWHLFSQWTDGVTNNPRSITVGSNASFIAIFVPSTPLEMLDLGGVRRLAPVGMPTVLVDGVFVVAESIPVRVSAEITLLTTFTNGMILFTLDGSDPTVSPKLYAGPFIVQSTVTCRAVAYTAGFTHSIQSDPLAVVVLPTLTATTDGGGSVTVDPPAGDYFSNSLAVVTATPLPGWAFLYWLGDAAGTNPIVSITMTEDRQVKAVFGTTLRTNMVGAESMRLSPLSDFYPYGTDVLVTATPQTGNYFAFWGSSASGTNNPLTFTMTNPNPIIMAVFLSSGAGSPAP